MVQHEVVTSARPGESPGRVHLNLKASAGQAPQAMGRSRTEWIWIAIIGMVVSAFVLMIAPILVYAFIAGDPG